VSMRFSNYGCLFVSGQREPLSKSVSRIYPKSSDKSDKCRSEQKPKDGGKKQPVNQAGYEPLL
jgi:hypothetical protein